jgi:hypothetical protein
MRRFARHVFTNLSGFAAVLSYCADRWFSDWLTRNSIEMSWGWLSIALLAIWIGAQIRQFENGDHWLQQNLAKRRQFVTVTMSRKQTTPQGFAYLVDLTFTRHVENVVVKVEVFQSRILGWGEAWVWRRLHRTTPLERTDCNKGDTESAMLVELRPVLDPPHMNALDPSPSDMRSKEGGYFKAKVTVTAHGFEPCVSEQVFLWRSKEIFPMPLDLPTSEDGDASDYKEEECILWAIK